MNGAIQDAIKPVFGKQCCLKRVWIGRSLVLGFGKKIKNENPHTTNGFHGEWEIRTHSCAWRIIKSGKILCGSHDTVESLAELDTAVDHIELGRIVSVCNLTDLDVRVGFNNGVAVDFLATFREKDGGVYISCPGNIYIKFSVTAGWKMGPLEKPWNESSVGDVPGRHD